MRDTTLVVCSDAAVLPFAAFTLARAHNLSPRRGFDLTLAHMDELELPGWLAALGVNTLRLRPGADLDVLNRAGRGRLPQTVYLRLWLAKALHARGYRRILYLDTDVMTMSGALDALLSVDLHGRAIGAVRDVSQWIRRKAPVFEFAANGHVGTPYFNSGVMLIDTGSWIDQDVTGRCLIEAEKRPIAPTHDQGLLNLALRGEWAELHPVWNWHVTRQHHALFPLLRPKMLHFAGFEKPWDAENGQFFHDPFVVSAYATFLSERFPDSGFSPADRHSLAHPMSAFATAAWQWMRFRSHLRRFQSDLHVLDPRTR